MTEQNETSKEFLQKIYNVEKWQSLHVQQLTYTRNLAIVLASASLGYTLDKINSNLTDVIKTLFIIVCFIQLISIIIGFIIALRESKNYRLKYKISRFVLKNASIDNIEKQCSSLENGNRCLITIQLVFLVVSIISETILFLII